MTLSVLAPLEAVGPKLAGLLAMSGVTDLLVNGWGQVWVQRGGNALEPMASPFESEAELGRLAQELIAKGGRHLDQANPFADVSIGSESGGGLRVHAALGSGCNPNTHISVRVHMNRLFGLEQLSDFGMFDHAQLGLLRQIILDRENFLISGATGSGKTTLLNMLAGFIPSSGGSILIDDKPVKGPGPDRGVVFQSFALFPWKTVLENVGFGPRMRGLPAAECDRIAREFLALVRLEHVADRYPNELSGGMQQRVGVVRALANNPDVLLMDEPFASVDAQTRMTLQEELTRIWQERRPTILFITHDAFYQCRSCCTWCIPCRCA